MTVEGADSSNLGVVQRKLTQKQPPPGDILSYGTTSLTTAGTVATGILEMAYDAASEFDFTDFMTCKVDTIPLIAAQGSATTIAIHTTHVGDKTLSRLSSCTCDDSPANKILNGFYVIFIVCIASLFN